MCTLVILHRPGHNWPLLLAGNRDEMHDRPWRSPDRHWPNHPNVVAGLDELAGGSWMGINDQGLAAVVMNRTGTLGPASDKRSRGELILMALAHTGAGMAAQVLALLHPTAYRPFNLVVADHRQAYWLRNDGMNSSIRPIPAGLHMLTSMELNDARDPRIHHYLPLFQSAIVPNPEQGDWSAWERLLAGHATGTEEPMTAAMCFQRGDGFGTRSSSCIALCKQSGDDDRSVWRFAAGAPDQTAYEPLEF